MQQAIRVRTYVPEPFRTGVRCRRVLSKAPPMGPEIWRPRLPGHGSSARGIVDDMGGRHHHSATFAFGGILLQNFQRGGHSMVRYVLAVTGLVLIGSMAQAQGTPTPEIGPVVDAAAVPFSEAAVNREFTRLSEDERYVLQQRLERRGFYQGTVDGLTGPGTREAIRQQAAALLSAGQEVRLDTEDGARTFLTGLLPMPAEELPEGDTFFGVWDCEGGQFSYRYDGYATSPDRVHLPYMSIEEFTPGNFGIIYMDGYRTGLMDVTPTTMIWSSPESGDTFECRRISPPPPRSPVPSETIVPAPETPEVKSEEVITAPAPKPEQIRTALVEAPAAAVLPESVWPFEGGWSCLSDTFGNGPMAFRFGPDAVTVPALGSTVGYADVAMIGGRERGGFR
jgi:hypothetical protein